MLAMKSTNDALACARKSLLSRGCAGAGEEDAADAHAADANQYQDTRAPLTSEIGLRYRAACCLLASTISALVHISDALAGLAILSFWWSSWWPSSLLILLHVPPLDSEPPIPALYVAHRPVRTRAAVWRIRKRQWEDA